MAALTGSITFSKFYVRGTLPEGFRDAFIEAIQLRAFRPLTVEEEAEERIGWCSVEHPMDTELDHDKVYFNHYLNLGLRVDRWRIPAAMLKAEYAQAERAFMAETGREKLRRSEKEELKFTVVRALRRKTLPSMRVADLSWNLDEGVVRYWSQSEGAIAAMVDLFEDTFGLELMAHGVYVAARERGLSDASLDRLPRLEASNFALEA